MEPISITSVTLASILASLPAANQPVSQSVISTHISPAIAGQWEIELPDDLQSTATSSESIKDSADKSLTLTTITTDSPVKSCREMYNFGEDNKMWAVSGDEWTYGKYLVTHPEQGLPIIAIKTIYDNNEKDCSGNQVDQSGEALVAYLNHHENQMQWCADPEGVECFMTFQRVLP